MSDEKPSLIHHLCTAFGCLYAGIGLFGAMAFAGAMKHYAAGLDELLKGEPLPGLTTLFIDHRSLAVSLLVLHSLLIFAYFLFTVKTPRSCLPFLVLATVNLGLQLLCALACMMPMIAIIQKAML
ncbi:MAG: hypothetical protein RL095_2981 [Verrucomicrobiota bacterium]|jgi:hypothetical protein